MTNDIFTFGAIAGIIANIPVNIFDYILYRLQINKVFIWQISASAFVERKDIKTTLGLIIGAVNDYIMAGIKGVFVMYLLYFTGEEFYIFKGIAAGLFFWVAFFGTALRLKIARIDPVEPITNLTHLAWHVLMGGLIVVLIVHGKFLIE